MNKLFLAGFLALSFVPAYASDLEGTWRIDLPRRGDVTLHTYLVLHQKGDVLDGKVIINGAVERPLRNPHLEGSDGVFGTNGNTEYRVHANGDHLRISITHKGKNPEGTTAIRVTENETRPPVFIPLPAAAAVPLNGLAQTPPMGWNSWNHFGDKVDDRTVRESADALVSSGLAAAGYVFVNIDDCWEGHRNPEGEIIPNSKFPDMKALADYIHSRGLKLGLYSSPGPVTCGGYQGSYGHEEQDAKAFAAWGIDYLKYDWCSAARVYAETDLQSAYQKMGQALAQSGRPIVYSLCEYGMGDVWKWGPQVGANLWRTTGDIQDNWKSMSKIGFDQSRLAAYAAPGHWNDPDMLEVGNGGMTEEEYRTHFSLWCLLAAPLMAGNDLRGMSKETHDILANPEVIALDQDKLGKQGERVASRDGIEIWTKSLRDGSVAVGVFNRTEETNSTLVAWSEIGLHGKPASLRDLWKHQDLAVSGDSYSAPIPAHGVLLLLMR